MSKTTLHTIKRWRNGTLYLRKAANGSSGLFWLGGPRYGFYVDNAHVRDFDTVQGFDDWTREQEKAEHQVNS